MKKNTESAAKKTDVEMNCLDIDMLTKNENPSTSLVFWRSAAFVLLGASFLLLFFDVSISAKGSNQINTAPTSVQREAVQVAPAPRPQGGCGA